MRKEHKASGKALSICGWHNHLAKDDKRRVWKSVRKTVKSEILTAIAGSGAGLGLLLPLPASDIYDKAK